jgi:hypothetical protein
MVVECLQLEMPRVLGYFSEEFGGLNRLYESWMKARESDPAAAEKLKAEYKDRLLQLKQSVGMLDELGGLDALQIG